MIKSKSLLFCIVVIIASSSYIGGLHATSISRIFRDVPSNHWATDAIEFVVSEGIMNGKNANEFSPDTPLTRAEFAMIVYRTSNRGTGAIEDAINAQRRSDINTILNAIYQYAIDNNGTLPFTYTSSKPIHICRTDIVCPKNMVDLGVLTGSYIVAVPVDPESKSKQSTDYTLSISKEKRITITAPLAKESISVTR